MSARIATRVISGGGFALVAWIALMPPLDPPADDARLTEAARIDKRIAAIDVRIVAKTVVARQLLAGRLSVAEATAVFLWLDQQPPDPSARGNDILEAEAVSPTPVVLHWAGSVASVRLIDPLALEGVGCLEDVPGIVRGTGSRFELPAVNEAGCNELLTWAGATRIHMTRGAPVDWDSADRLPLIQSRH
jgi:hypothetical protein